MCDAYDSGHIGRDAEHQQRSCEESEIASEIAAGPDGIPESIHDVGLTTKHKVCDSWATPTV